MRKKQPRHNDRHVGNTRTRAVGARPSALSNIQPENCRVDTLLGALIYMMTLYQRGRRGELATSIAAHLECLARHPDADDIVRQVARGMHGEWRATAADWIAATPAPRAMSLN